MTERLGDRRIGIATWEFPLVEPVDGNRKSGANSPVEVDRFDS